MSSSRWYSNYNSATYRSKQSTSYNNNYYSKISQSRATYSYQPAQSTKSPKSKTRSSTIRDSGRIPGPYSPTLGRKKPVGTWKAKKKEEEERKTRKGEYIAETVEEALAKYKKGVFHYDEKLAEKGKNKKKSSKTNMNGHKSTDITSDTYSKHGLLKTTKPAPQVIEKVDELPGANKTKENKDKSNDREDDDTKEQSSKSKKESSDKKKESKREVNEDTKRKSSKKTSSSSSRTKSKKKKQQTRIQPIVTVSPQRPPPAPYAAIPAQPQPTDYYHPQGFNYGAPPPTGYTSYDYHVPPPINEPPYTPLATAGYPYNPYGTLVPPPPTSTAAAATTTTDPYYAPYGSSSSYRPGYYTDQSGLWYPYQAGTTPTATYIPQPILPQDTYLTPKSSKRGKKRGDSANVDLTTPLNDDKSNGIKKQKMSPGRRVNKIQKQLEYYFSTHNMDQDDYLKESMDKEGWVAIDTLLGFNRMKQLGATKELVIEAAFHSQIIEVEGKNQNKLRMSKYWKQYIVSKSKQSSNRVKKKSSSSSKKKSASRVAREKEKALDAAEVNQQTILSIVKGIQDKMERRKNRQKAKRKKEEQEKKEKEKEKETEIEKDKDKDKDKEKGDDNGASDKENDDNKENVVENDDKDKAKDTDKDKGDDKGKDNDNDKDKVDKDDNDNDKEADYQELIKKDQEEAADDDLGDPEHNDMVEID